MYDVNQSYKENLIPKEGTKTVRVKRKELYINSKKGISKGVRLKTINVG